MATTRYATFAELAAQLDDFDANKYQTRIEALLTNCSEAINNVCHRPDGFIADTVATARPFVGSGHDLQRINECVEITLVEVKNSINDTTYTTWSSTDWLAFGGNAERPDFNVLAYDEPRPYTGLLIAISGTKSHFTSGKVNVSREGFEPRYDYFRTRKPIGQPTVRVTAKWGYSVAVPDAIKQATIIQAMRFFKRGQSAWADAIANSDFQELRFVKKSDPTYDYLVQHGFIRPGIG